ncbi:unnamed protein product [Penicillium manginii]
MAELTEREKMLRGELFCAFTPDMVAARARCKYACNRFNNTSDEVPRRRLIEMWRDITDDKTPLPPKLIDQAADDEQFKHEPWIEAPIKVDYGFNVKLGAGVFVNFNCVFIDTCPITGPEMGKPIFIGEDCWIGGNVIVLPGVSIGKGSTIGAGSIVTKDVPAFHVAAGNPARIIRKIETTMRTS